MKDKSVLYALLLLFVLIIFTRIFNNKEGLCLIGQTNYCEIGYNILTSGNIQKCCPYEKTVLSSDGLKCCKSSNKCGKKDSVNPLEPVCGNITIKKTGPNQCNGNYSRVNSKPYVSSVSETIIQDSVCCLKSNPYPIISPTNGTIACCNNSNSTDFINKNNVIKCMNGSTEQGSGSLPLL